MKIELIKLNETSQYYIYICKNRTSNEGNSKEENPKEENSDNDIENHITKINIIFIIAFVILLFSLMPQSFFCGTKLKARRKKRANEPKEDNHEHFPEIDNKNNKIITIFLLQHNKTKKFYLIIDN